MKIPLICITCNPELQAAIFDSRFMPNLFLMLSGFIVLGLITAVLSWVSVKRFRAGAGNRPNPVPMATAALVSGIGLGGFADGIALHQLLQWHQMLSNQLPPTTLEAKSVNMFWDGIFHAFCLIVALTGIVLLWKSMKVQENDRSGRLLAGGLLAGWGLFNIVEGLIDHHFLKLHNVREISTNPDLWNWGFLLFSVLLIAAGYGLMKNRLFSGNANER